MKITELTKVNISGLNLSEFKNSFWQSGIWMNIVLNSNQADSIFLIEKDEKYIILEKRKITFGYGLFSLGTSEEILDLFKTESINLAKKESCLFVQFETINYDGYEKIGQNFSPSQENIENKKKGQRQALPLQNNYYKKFITPYTALIDLSKTDEEILALMKPKGRYNIKVAEKNNINVVNVSKTDENIKVFYDLMLETTSRDSFNGNNFDFYKNFLNLSDNNLLFIAYYGETPVRAGIFVYFGDIAIYYYGASTSKKEFRNMMAPYLLQWTAISEGKKRGCKLYDFLGIASPNEINSTLSGVTDFKLKLTPDSREVSRSEIYILNKLKYKFIILIRKLKR